MVKMNTALGTRPSSMLIIIKSWITTICAGLGLGQGGN